MNGSIVSVQVNKMAKEGVAILMNNVWPNTLINFGSVSSTTLFVQVFIV